MSKIEWTDRTWNPITGCSKISEGCRNCYAEDGVKRNKKANGHLIDGQEYQAMPEVCK